ncbi:hypothetical protein [Streptomyces sp. NPDC088789]|uniref:hypothetical protein n=1 Tax=Streptomyces sp. NPDC088789 TaxID=3365899 RepID=UPI00381379D8
MNASARPTSHDAVLEAAFGAPVAQLHVMAHVPGASAALWRALELRTFLAVAEEQVARVRDRVHQATDPGRDQDELSPDALRMDADWLRAALESRVGYRAALEGLLRSMPPPAITAGKAQLARPRIATVLPPAAPLHIEHGAAADLPSGRGPA